MSNAENLCQLIRNRRQSDEPNAASTLVIGDDFFSGMSVEQIDAIQALLQSEFSKSYFDADHFAKTVQLKKLFNYATADKACWLLGQVFPNYQTHAAEGILGSVDNQQITAATEQLRTAGYHIFRETLAADVCDRICNALREVTFRVKANGELLDGFREENIFRPAGNTCWVLDQQQVLSIPEVQHLVIDPTLLTIVQQFFGCMPIHVQSNCWWTINQGVTDHSKSADAQMFHQDKEFVRFLKMFIYLNDVDRRNGPHTYIAGSARDYEQNVPGDYAISQRLSDDYLLSQYGADRFVTIEGSRGTIVLEDTSGFHKGEPVMEGYRLMLQIEFACSLFFNPVPSFTLNGLGQPLKEVANEFPRLFLNYDHARYQAACAARQAKIVEAARIDAARAAVPPPKRRLRDRLKSLLGRR